ncbi:MAG: thioredoxin [Nannocystaceae bacterium]|nr:thioredoxin [Nannocystaceae bacterium]
MRPPRIALFLTLILAACVGEAEKASRSGLGPSAAEKTTQEVAEAPTLPRPEFVKAAHGPVPALVRAALDQAGAGRTVLVYVGAQWCEPCTRFHDAVQAGELDEPLKGVLFIEFDSDHDGERLSSAGYDGKLIPRFVVPNLEGDASPRRVEGGIKGAGAVQHIMRRLAPMLTK